MKNILKVILIGLFLSSCATTSGQVSKGSIKPGITKRGFCNKVFFTSFSSDPCFMGGIYYNASTRKEVLHDPKTRTYFVFRNVNIQATGGHAFIGDGILEKIVYSKDEAFKLANPPKKQIVKKDEPKKKKQPKEKKPKKQLPKDNEIVAAGSGSGFIVSKDGHIITNYHVIEGCDVNKITFKGIQSDVKTLAVDKVNDIAILKSNASPKIFFPVSNEDVSLLEEVIVAGFPLGKQISSAIKTHKGVVTALAGAGDNYSYFQTDAAINQGNSGGPIINKKGNVVGIAVQTWIEEGVQSVHFGIKSSTLKTFANSNDLKFSSPNYRELSNKDLGKLITESTVYVECHMTIAKIKKMIAASENKKAFFKEYE